MEKKKRPLGYLTPSMQIQEEYKELLEQLKKKKANWEKILTDSIDSHDNFFKGSDYFFKRLNPKKNPYMKILQCSNSLF